MPSLHCPLRQYEEVLRLLEFDKTLSRDDRQYRGVRVVEYNVVAESLRLEGPYERVEALEREVGFFDYLQQVGGSDGDE